MEIEEKDYAEVISDFAKVSISSNEKKQENVNEGFNFSWEPKDGLKNIPQEEFNIAYKLATENVKIDSELTDEKIVIRNIPKCEELKTLANYKSSTSTLKRKVDSIGLCKEPKCGRRSCPSAVAGYIYYLIKTGNEDKIKEDREYYKEHEDQILSKYSKKFQFKYDFKNGLNDVTDEMLEIAEKIVDNSWIEVGTELTDNKEMPVRYLKGLCESINEPDTKAYANRSFGFYNPKGKCGKPTCKYSFCPIRLATYVYYLKNIGKYNELKQKRLEEREKLDEAFNEYENAIPNIKNVLNSLYNPEEKNFYCIVEGEKGVGKRELVEKIVSILYKNGKITSDSYEPILFQNLMSQLAHSYTYKNEGHIPNVERRHENIEKKRKMHVIGEHEQTREGEVEYFQLQDNKVYVLTGIDEFIKDFDIYKDGRSEIRKKQIKNLLDNIGTIKDNKYVIIVGDNKNIEKLLKLDSRLKFIYEESRLIFPEVKIDNMFNEYKKYLNNENTNLLMSCEAEIKNKFIEFVSLNSTYLPFGNYELSRYLAKYSNIKGDLIFPSNMYKKESVDESLANIIGLDNVKEKVKEFEEYMIFRKKSQASGLKLASNNMHMMFTGNPGTGKTTIARIMAKMLFDLGIISENKLIEVERKDLIAQYTGQTAPKTSEVIEKAMGGVLFIDEAYSLKLGNNDIYGDEAISTLIKAMEDRKGEFVVIFAGYKDEMRTFMKANAGIQSRIGYTFDFPNYNEEELMKIFEIKAKKMGLSIDENVENKLVKVFEYFTKQKFFGNGRFVDRVLQETMIKHSKNYTNDSITVISSNDIPEIEDLLNNDNKISELSIDEQLKSIIGLTSVKEQLKEFERYIEFTKELNNRGINIPAQNMHMIFTGNPGCGKTTIARIIAKILFDIGVIYENKLVEVDRKDLVGEHIGETAPKTAEVIEKAMGGVLFVDEAYSLTPKDGGRDFGQEAIATLIKAMEDHKGEFIVIFAGYKDEMHTFMKANAGIESRIGYKFDFPDYNKNELLEIYNRKMSKIGFELEKEAELELLSIFDYFSKKKSFGNGRFVDKVMQQTLINHSQNFNQENLLKISSEDLPTIEQLTGNLEIDSSTVEMELEKIVGLSKAKEKIKELEKYVLFSKKAQKQHINLPMQNTHMLFVGNPGTGKTTMARIIAKMLFNVGILHENKLIEVERKDLVAEYTGQTAPKTSEVIEKAMGGVLFIDEAYSLKLRKDDTFGDEAINTLIKAMEDHKGEFVVIFAGYRKEMNEFLGANSGIASRIGYTFEFEDYDADELLKIFNIKMRNYGFILSDEIQTKVRKIMQYFCGVKNFGNGRFVDRVIQETLVKHSQNINLKDVAVIELEDIPEVKEIIDVLANSSRMINPEDITEESIRRTAVHEIGHATVGYLLFTDPNIEKITINVEGRGSLGYVMYKKESGKFNYSKEDCENLIKRLLAGAAAERLYYGYNDTGYGSDLEKATNIALNMITEYGMSNLGLARISSIRNSNMGEAIYKEANSILDKCLAEAYELLENNKKKMDKAIEYLLEHREISEEEFLECFDN